MAWREFQWGSRGLAWETDEEGIFMMHRYITDGIRIHVEGFDTGAGTVMHVLHALNPGGVADYSACLDVALATSNWVESSYKNMFPSSRAVRRVVATAMNARDAAQAVIAVVHTGVRGGTASPNSIACAVDFTTRSSGRRRHGGPRCFAPTNGDWAADRFTAGYLSALQGVWNNLLAALAVGGHPLSVASMTDLTCYPVQDISIRDDILDTQKTRLPGHGR